MKNITKGVWRLSQKTGSNKIVIFQENNMSTGKIAVVNHNQQHSKEEAEANAAFIVTACNLHSELVEALKWAKKVIEASVPKQAGYGAIEILPVIETLLQKANS